MTDWQSTNQITPINKRLEFQIHSLYMFEVSKSEKYACAILQIYSQAFYLQIRQKLQTVRDRNHTSIQVCLIERRRRSLLASSFLVD